MSLKFKTVLRIEGILMLVLAASMAPSLLIALINGEASSAKAFAMVIAVCFVTGIITRHFCSLSHYNIKIRDGFLIVSLSWLVVSVVGAFPAFLSGSIPSYVDAFFEACSGFSTTGASILNDIEVLPRSILFWRSFTHWLGGMGILVFIAALLPTFGVNAQIVANAETPGPTKDKITAKFSDGAKSLYRIYIVMTVAETLLLKLGGLSWFDSFIHTFGTVGTGGLSSYNASIGHFDSLYVEIVIMLFMFMAAINFNLYFLARRRGISNLLRDEEFRFYVTVIGVAGLAITLCNAFANEFAHVGETLVNSFFQVISIVSTTGYGTDDFTLWPTFAQLIIFCLFFLGGCSSSTGGGVKCVRILTAMKLIKRGISLKVHPKRIAPVTLNDKEVSSETCIKISNFLFTYIVIVFAGMILLSINGFDFMTNLSASASCLGNIGPGFNLVGPAMNYAMFSDFSKIVCSLLMITGRLELYTVLVLLSRHYWNPDKV